uniref:Peptidase A2 domain-containing protein n=1 Tax=Gopherus evgoodei TaxID=1825980 RepID=A0A8C4XVS7_9SAUR
MERGLLEDLSRGARIPVTKAVLVTGFPEEMEPNEIEESLDAAEILGRVKVHTRIYNHKVKGMVTLCTHSKEADLDKVPKEVKVEGIPWTILGADQSPPSVPVSLELDSLAQKLQALMVDEKRTREELILALGGAPTPAAPSLVRWAKELRNALKDALKPVYESAPYKWLRSFSGVSPVPSGEDDYETWRDFTVPLVQEWEYSDAEKRKRVLETLKDSQPTATVQDYLTALESVYGTTDSGEDLYYHFCYQEPHERMSDFIRRLEDLLQQEASGKHQQGLGKEQHKILKFQGSPEKNTNRGYPDGLIGPQAIVPVSIEGRLCEALLDSGSQVTILYESYYREHLQHLPLHPLSGLTVWGIGCDSCPYRGYILLNVQFPKNVVGINQEIETLALVCPDPKGRKYGL